MPLKTITHATAVYVLGEVFRTGKDPLQIVEEQDLWEMELGLKETVELMLWQLQHIVEDED